MRRRPRLDSADLDGLLDGNHSDDSALSRVIAAARAPGRPADVAGLRAARSAFLNVDRAAPKRAPSTTLPAATRTAFGRLLALKTIAAISGVTLIGGVAYAASSTSLLGGSTHHRQPAHHRSGAGTDDPSWNSAPQPLPASSGGASLRAGHHPKSARPTTPRKSIGASVVASARASHSHPTVPTSPPAHPSGTPTSPTAPAGHARTTPPHRPTNPAGTHSVHPTPTPGPHT